MAVAVRRHLGDKTPQEKPRVFYHKFFFPRTTAAAGVKIIGFQGVEISGN